jgi:phenylacetic acid degradation operon negative regulatory protein
MSTDARPERAFARIERPEIPTRLLVHALVREDGTVDAGELYAVAGILGMSDQQVRLSLKRLVAEGKYTHEGRGRKAVLRALADVTGSIAPDVTYVSHAYRQDHGLAPWDGTWHLIAFAVPEHNRAARDTLRNYLLYLGATPIHGGLYVSANPIERSVEAQARHLGVRDSLILLTSTDLRVGPHDDPRTLAAELWPLEEIADRHRQLTAYAESCLAELDEGAEPSGAQRLALAMQLATEFSRALTPDPLLPPELLPQPWPGSRARRLTATCWARLFPVVPAQHAGEPLPRLFRLYADLLSRSERQP